MTEHELERPKQTAQAQVEKPLFSGFGSSDENKASESTMKQFPNLTIVDGSQGAARPFDTDTRAPSSLQRSIDSDKKTPRDWQKPFDADKKIPTNFETDKRDPNARQLPNDAKIVTPGGLKLPLQTDKRNPSNFETDKRNPSLMHRTLETDKRSQNGLSANEAAQHGRVLNVELAMRNLTANDPRQSHDLYRHQSQDIKGNNNQPKDGRNDNAPQRTMLDLVANQPKIGIPKDAPRTKVEDLRARQKPLPYVGFESK